MKFSQKMRLYFFYAMVQKSQKWPKTQIKGGPALNLLLPMAWRTWHTRTHARTHARTHTHTHTHTHTLYCFGPPTNAVTHMKGCFPFTKPGNQHCKRKRLHAHQRRIQTRAWGGGGHPRERKRLIFFCAPARNLQRGTQQANVRKQRLVNARISVRYYRT